MKNPKKTTVFLVDDDAIFLKVLETQFHDQTKHDIKTFSSGEECMKNLHQNPDIIFLDYYLNPSNPKANTGLQILDKIKAENPQQAVVMLSSQDRIEVAVNCMKHQAFDYIIKSEAAFVRAQKSISTLFYQKELAEKVKYYRTSSIIAVSLLCLIIVTVAIIEISFPELMNK